MLDYPLFFVERLGEHDLEMLAGIDDAGDTVALRKRLALEPEAIDARLADPSLYAALFESGDADAIQLVSPSLAFAVLVHRTVRDLESAAYVPEWVGAGERLPVFDVVSLREFISDLTRRFLVIDLLTSFTRVASGSVWVRTQRGYRRRRYSELDPVSLAEMVESLPVEQRPAGYRRLGDVALFLTGVFPDHTARHPVSAMHQARLARSSGVAAERGAGIEYLYFLEVVGRHWYDRAADGPFLPAEGRQTLHDLAANFAQARRFLNYLADSYLHRFETGLMHPVA